MATDGDALYRAVAANLDDDTPRLIYADWLDENGLNDRAVFIRLRINSARGVYYDNNSICNPLTPELIAKSDDITNELLVAHQVEWENQIRQTLRVSCKNVNFRRGFPCDVRVRKRPGIDH